MNGSIVNFSNGTSLICHRDTRIAHVVFPVLYTVVFLIGLILNSLAAWAFFQIRSTSTFIVYLKNTLISDSIMTLMLPLKILTDSGLGPWQLKAFVCRVSAVIFYEAMYVSIVLLGLIAFDRFLKIARPYGKLWVQNVTSAKIIAGIVWISFFSLSLPNMILSNKKAMPHSVKKCASLKNHLGLKWHEAVTYICQFVFWAVLILMFLFYAVITKKVYMSYKKTQKKDSKSKQRTKGKVFIIVIVFFVCFAPYHFSRVPYTLSQTHQRMDCSIQNQLFIAKEGTLWLASTNICMDPLIYIFLCRSFLEKAFCVKVKKFRSTIHENPTVPMDTRISV
ncbi:P2Y purinoceptor 13 [Alligator mississippiensis]|uniref:P2Y purinoceptor 13 n=1 Tax=Alligator mississippiensis TaxID=8496 RepID=UPI00071141B8|nr:P2Y purinoceptor 13 [Alligator mississippiensis]